MPTIQQALRAAAARLQQSDTATLDAQLLLCEVLGCNTAHLAAWPEKILQQSQLEAYQRLLSRRAAGEPVAYIRGRREFYSRDFHVDANTLIPRPETECLVEFVLQDCEAQQRLEVIDLGTGSGIIAVTLACERPRWRITASDSSAAALEVARGNADSHGADIRWRQADWFDGIEDRFDLVISNPPYVATADPHLAQGDLRFEPAGALAAGSDGLDAIRRICAQAGARLKPGGRLVLEHGFDQQQAVADMLAASGLADIVQGADYAGLPRFSAARRAA